MEDFIKQLGLVFRSFVPFNSATSPVLISKTGIIFP